MKKMQKRTQAERILKVLRLRRNRWMAAWEFMRPELGVLRCGYTGSVILTRLKRRGVLEARWDAKRKYKQYRVCQNPRPAGLRGWWEEMDLGIF